MRRVIVLMLALAAVSSAALAQDFRGAITGRITDSSSARMPGVTVVATNVATNVTQTTTTNGEGDYAILFLNPGTYTVAAELSGFKKVVRTTRGADRRQARRRHDARGRPHGGDGVGHRRIADARHDERVGGQVIDEKTISMMPLSDGNPFALARLVPGVAYTGDLKFSRPFDNGGTSGITAASTGGNEFTLDGSPNMANGRRVAFVPPAGAVQEFKVETFDVPTRAAATRPAPP
jgi:hypothetical protein